MISRRTDSMDSVLFYSNSTDAWYSDDHEPCSCAGDVAMWVCTLEGAIHLRCAVNEPAAQTGGDVCIKQFKRNSGAFVFSATGGETARRRRQLKKFDGYNGLCVCVSGHGRTRRQPEPTRTNGDRSCLCVVHTAYRSHTVYKRKAFGATRARTGRAVSNGEAIIAKRER